MKMRAFIFDDNELVRSLVSLILEKRGYEVFAFSDATLCPIFLRNDCPCPSEHTCTDIIVADINMPNITGLDFIENQLNFGCKVRNFGVISGNWTNARIEQAKRLNCQIFEKPIDFEHFEKWLDDCERRSDPERKLSDWFQERDKENE
ncbi:MAG: response regulator [Planctomycetes bacterium]|nr:response regulator [Planctomycetota bacterium]